MKFSIVTPVTYNKDDPDNLRMPRYEMFKRCMTSVYTQTCPDYEWIVVDDKCNPSVQEEVDIFNNKSDCMVVRVVPLSEKSGRIIARNAGMKEAQGEWICWLDADDEYASWYLQVIDEATKVYPDYKVFNFNHLIFNYDYSCYIRKFIDMEAQGDKPFRAGVVGAGSFVYHRSVMEEVGLFPELGLWDFAYKFLEEFPEVRPLYWNEAKQDYDCLGNPWGEDYAYFYRITRKYKSKYLNIAPYFVHSRWGHKLPDAPDFVKDPGKAPEINLNNI